MTGNTDNLSSTNREEKGKNHLVEAIERELEEFEQEMDNFETWLRNTEASMRFRLDDMVTQFKEEQKLMTEGPNRESLGVELRRKPDCISPEWRKRSINTKDKKRYTSISRRKDMLATLGRIQRACRTEEEKDLVEEVSPVLDRVETAVRTAIELQRSLKLARRYHLSTLAKLDKLLHTAREAREREAAT